MEYSKKVFYCDIESTGLDPKKHDIVKLAYIIEIDGEVKREDEFCIRPSDFSTVSQKALEVNRLTVEELEHFPVNKLIHTELTQILSIYVNRYDKTDKFVPVGYNVRFDLDFLRSFFEKCDDLYFGSYFHNKPIDPLYLLFYLDYLGEIKLPNYKLETVCRHFKIELDAHDAMSDIKATRQLLTYLNNIIGINCKKGLN